MHVCLSAIYLFDCLSRVPPPIVHACLCCSTSLRCPRVRPRVRLSVGTTVPSLRVSAHLSVRVVFWTVGPSVPMYCFIERISQSEERISTLVIIVSERTATFVVIRESATPLQQGDTTVSID